jgi:hypothetical protein
MGQSTNGIYFFGMCSEEEDLELDYDEWPYDKQCAFEKEHGVEVGYHCSSECTMMYLAIKDTKVTACRGYPEKITPMGISPEWEKTLNEAADKLGWPQEARDISWWLTSYWG